MASNAINRKDVRSQLQTILSAALTGGGNPYQVVLSEERRSFKQQSPVLLILSSSIEGDKFGIGTTKWEALHRFAALSFVAEADPDNGWTELEVEDTLDDCAKALMDAIMDNQKNTPHWHNLNLEGPSQVLPATVGGDPYKMETFTIMAEVYDA